MKIAITDNNRKIVMNNKFEEQSILVHGEKKDAYLMIKPVSNDNIAGFNIADNLIPCNRETGQFFGMFIGDGWSDADGIYGNGVRIHLASIHNPLIDAYREGCNKYLRQNKQNINGVHYKNKEHDYWKGYVSTHGKFSICTGHAVCASMLKLFGHGAKNKTFPDYFLNAPDEFRWGLISGLMDTDGTFVNRKQMKDGKLQNNKFSAYSTISYKLACKVQLLCFTLGINASITTAIHKHKDRNNVTEHMVLLSVKHLTELRDNFSLLIPQKADILNSFIIGGQPYRKDILPYDASINRIVQKMIPCKKRISFASSLYAAKNRGYITRQTFDRVYYGAVKEAFDSKFNYNHQYEIVKDIIEVANE